MTKIIQVGLIGVGGMGRTHFNCYRNNPNAKIVALCDLLEDRRNGNWDDVNLNIGTNKSNSFDMSQIKSYENYNDLIADPNVQMVDICLPTRLHAPVAIAAMKAGKDVLCEKPMAWTVDEAREMEAVAQQTGRHLQIAHCLRYWSHYTSAAELINSGKYGKLVYASFHRSSGAPRWGNRNWLITQSESGGAVLDMHIHDVDAALWWFGKPDSIHADGTFVNGLSTTVDSTWRYRDGGVVSLHGCWDLNGGTFRYAFKVVLEKATIWFDSAENNPNIQIIANEKTEVVSITPPDAYQLEIDDMIDCLQTGRKNTRVPVDSSRLAVEISLTELAQIQDACGIAR